MHLADLTRYGEVFGQAKLDKLGARLVTNGRYVLFKVAALFVKLLIHIHFTGNLRDLLPCYRPVQKMAGSLSLHSSAWLHWQLKGPNQTLIRKSAAQGHEGKYNNV
jgi:hypothetical protein